MFSKRVKIVLMHILILLVACLAVVKYADQLYIFKNVLYAQLHPVEPVQSDTLIVEPHAVSLSESPWFEDTRLIYHAGGAVDGFTYTNSREAVTESIAKGNLVVEMDFSYTTDGQLICLHLWEDAFPLDTALSLEEFTGRSIQGRFTPMTARDLFSIMAENPELRVVVDTKENDIAKFYGNLIRQAEDYPDVLERIIIQLYYPGQKADICKLYPFSDEQFLFTAYCFGPERVQEIAQICREEKICVITIPYQSWSAQQIDAFNRCGYVIFEHTVNRPDQALYSLDAGIHGFYTDSLQLSDLNFPEK